MNMAPEILHGFLCLQLKNGRLAMLAFIGFASTAAVNGKGPIESLLSHIADPNHNNSECLLPGLCFPVQCRQVGYHGSFESCLGIQH